MRITALTCLHADAGHRRFDVLKVTADEGLVGWSEYNQSFGGKGVTAAIEPLAPLVTRAPTRPWWRCSARAAAGPAAASDSGRSARSRTCCSTTRWRTVDRRGALP